MKGIYLNFVLPEEIGIKNKIEAQIEAMKNLKIDMSRIEISEGNVYFNNKIINKYRLGNTIIDKVLRKLDLYFCLKKLQNKKLYENIDFIYVRYFFTSFWSLNYFKFLKEIGIKIFLEIPTYPYDNEMSKFSIVLNVDKILRKYNKKYIDKIITYSQDSYIWSIPCISISNGIDLTKIKIKKREEHTKINFISVSNHSFWHGIDRILYSLLDYLKETSLESINFHIIGQGKETENLKKIVSLNKKLEDIVIFHGFKKGEDLEKIYNNSDIAIGALGSFRQGMNQGSALKHREYCAKGLPFITGDIDYSFENCKFVYKVPNDDSLINIKKVIKWYKNLNINSEEIRKYAVDNLSWDIQMEKVINNIK